MGLCRRVVRGLVPGLTALLSLAACAERDVAPAAAAPIAPAREVVQIDRFEAQVDAHRKSLGIPGLSVAVLKDGAVLSARGFGHADLEQGVPASANTLYHIASVTKTFTAILVLQLAEQGKLDLEAPVSTWLDEFKGDPAQLKHLLSHTSEGTPGEKYAYNPDRFEHLKAILEKASGKPLRQMFVETFLAPLDMRDSVPGPDVVDDATTWAVLGERNLARYREVLKRFARPYTFWGDGETVYSGYPPRDFWASAGLLSTVSDLAKYDLAVDRHELLKPETLERAWKPVVNRNGESLAMGLGWFVTDYRDTQLIWHYGHWGTGFSALYLKVPQHRLTLIALANSEALADHHYRIGEDVTNDLFACSLLETFVPSLKSSESANPSAHEVSATGPSTDCAHSSRVALERWRADRRAKARQPVPLDAALAAEYAGRYRFSHREVTVTAEADRLFIDVPVDERSELFAAAPSEFFLKNRQWTLTFVRESGRIARLDVREGDETVSAVRIEPKD